MTVNQMTREAQMTAKQMTAQPNDNLMTRKAQMTA